jgi:hypothetical protein
MANEKYALTVVTEKPAPGYSLVDVRLFATEDMAWEACVVLYNETIKKYPPVRMSKNGLHQELWTVNMHFIFDIQKVSVM